MLHYTRLERLARDKHLFICPILKLWRKWSVVICEYGSRDCIHNNSFSLYLTNGPTMLDCYITPGWRGLPGTNTLVYLVPFLSYEENEVFWFVNTAHGAAFTIIHFLCYLQMAQSTWMLHYTSIRNDISTKCSNIKT
jgi:hypothetical protein